MTREFVNPNKIFNPFMTGNYTLSADTYKSLAEKKKFWSSSSQLHYERISNKKQFDEFYIRNSNQGYIPKIFRGVNDAKYKMLTSLQVAYLVKELKNSSYNKRVAFVQLEIDHIADNKRKYCRNGQFPNGIEDVDFLYMSFLQHFGLYTPFLDFSYNLDKALFFAQDKMNTDNIENDIDKYVSVYWLEPSRVKTYTNSPVKQLLTQIGVSGQNELVDILKWYRDSLTNVISKLQESIALYGSIDTINIEPKNFYSWSNPTNNGEGLNKIKLGYIAENNSANCNSIKSFRELVDLLEIIKDKAAKNTLTQYEFDNYVEALGNSLDYNIRLSNLNLNAQEGCFLYYNPEEEGTPLEDYWVNNPTFTHKPILHCVDIKKELVVAYIQPLLIEKNITTETIYPKGCDIAKQDMTTYLQYLNNLSKE